MASACASEVKASRASDQRALKQVIQQMNRALRDSEGGGLMERFETTSKLLFLKLVDEREAVGQWNGSGGKAAEDLLWRQGDRDRALYERARALWIREVQAYPNVFVGDRAQFPRDVSGVARALRILETIRLSQVPNDVKGGAYEEMLRNTLEKNENQQFFTPRHVVDFIVSMTSPEPEWAACDPAAGSGGFLVGALNHVESRWGDKVASFAERVRGAEVDERMAWVARINVLMHGGNPQSVSHVPGSGSLASQMLLRPILPFGAFDLILTNPPFGSDLTDRTALSDFETGRGRSSRRRGVLFVERCLSLLRSGGRLAVILDDSVLNLPTNDDVRRLIKRESIVEAVISLPDVTFMPYSTAKSSVLFLRKRRSAGEIQPRVFMADVEEVGIRPNGDPLYADHLNEMGGRALKTDLPAVLDIYRGYRNGFMADTRAGCATVFSANIDDHQGQEDGSRLDVFFFHPARRESRSLLDRSRFPKKRLGQLVEVDGRTVNPSTESADDLVQWIGLGDIEANTGRFELREMPGGKIRSSAHAFRAGDLLFSRLRPKLRKALLVPAEVEGGVCSSELLVLRVRQDALESVDPEFLAFVLRSDLTYGQLIYQITGIGRPRVSAEAVRRVELPLPPLVVQRDMVRDLKNAEREADRLRREAAQLLSHASGEVGSAFERMVDGLVDSSAYGSISSGVGSDASDERAAV